MHCGIKSVCTIIRRGNIIWRYFYRQLFRVSHRNVVAQCTVWGAGLPRVASCKYVAQCLPICLSANTIYFTMEAQKKAYWLKFASMETIHSAHAQRHFSLPTCQFYPSPHSATATNLASGLWRGGGVHMPVSSHFHPTPRRTIRVLMLWSCPIAWYRGEWQIYIRWKWMEWAAVVLCTKQMSNKFKDTAGRFPG